MLSISGEGPNPFLSATPFTSCIYRTRYQLLGEFFREKRVTYGAVVVNRRFVVTGRLRDVPSMRSGMDLVRDTTVVATPAPRCTAEETLDSWFMRNVANSAAIYTEAAGLPLAGVSITRANLPVDRIHARRVFAADDAGASAVHLGRRLFGGGGIGRSRRFWIQGG